MIKKQLITNNNSNNKLNKKGLTFLTSFLIMIMLTALIAFSANAQTDNVRPTILSIFVSPANNEEDVLRNEQITIVFSEDMDPSTINKNTFMLMQRTTPESGNFRYLSIEETLSYFNRTVTFSPKNESSYMFTPNQQYGNVFTVTITNGTKDLANNSLSRNYVWSFTTGTDPFNKGITTSNLDQSALPIAHNETNQTQLIEPIFVAAPIQNTQTGTSSSTSFWSLMPIWVWIVSLLALILVLALIFGFSSGQENKTISEKFESAGTTLSPFGDVHPVIKLEGIGDKYNEKLAAIGITNTHQLWEANAKEIARKTGVSLKLVESWQNMAELSSVKGIGPQYAELLERSGIHSIAQLKNYDPNNLLKLVRKKQDSLKINIQGNSTGHATVENWIDEAKDHKFSETELHAATN